jgi:hypothetical protein
MAPLSLFLALLVGLSAPAFAEPNANENEEVPLETSPIKKEVSDKKDPGAAKEKKLDDNFDIDTLKKSPNKKKDLKKLLLLQKEKAETRTRLNRAGTSLPPPQDQPVPIYQAPPDSGDGVSAGETTVAPTERSLEAQRETSRGMSRSSAKAVGAASRAAQRFQQALPQLGEQAAGDAKDGLLRAGDAVPDPNRDLGLAKAGAHKDTIHSMGLDVRTGGDGRAQVVRGDGTPAAPEEVAELRRRISAEPAALARYPSFYSQVSRERYTDLKNAYGTPGTQAAFRDVSLSQGARDFLWSRSCSIVSGDCNSHATGSHYKKGDYVPPSTLSDIWDDIGSEADSRPAEDALANSEYSDGEKKEATSALSPTPLSFGAVSALLERARQAVGGWFGGGASPAATTEDAMLASAILVNGSAGVATSVGAQTSGARFAHEPGEPSSPDMKEGPAGFRRTGPRFNLTSLLVAAGALLLAAGLVLRRS